MSEKYTGGEHHSSHRHNYHEKQSIADKFLGTKKRNRLHSAKRLQHLSHATSKRNIDSYMLLSRRVIFCIIFLGIIAYICYYAFVADTTDQTLSTAQLTNSEINQLKIQITQLKQKMEEMELELNRYKELYGELDDVPSAEE